MSTTDQTTRIPTGTWTLDPVHSSIGFGVNYSGVGTFRGTFADFDAKLVDGRLEGIAKVASVKVDDENLTGHLQTPGLLRRRAVSRAPLRLERRSSGTATASRSRAT